MAIPRATSRILRTFSSHPPFVPQSALLGGPRYPQCVPPFDSRSAYNTPTSRHLQTAAVFQPHSLPTEPLPQPPRNKGVPESSIAGGVSETNNNRSSRLPQQYGLDEEAASPETSSICVTEAEAQKSKPVLPRDDSTSTTSPSGSPRPRKSRLRARKAAMTLTPSAVAALRELLDQPDPKLIRVGVKNRGCSGLAYHLEYVEKPGLFDELVEQDGVKVLVDSKALFSIIGSEMDWVEDKLSRRFTFRNPNLTEQCGCGESFSVS